MIRFLVTFCLLMAHAQARPIHEYMDLQTHLTMGHTYPMFGNSLRDGTDAEIEDLSHQHMFTNVIFGNLLKNNSGARVIINGAIAFEYAKNKDKVKESLLGQIEAVNAFAKANDKDFVVARTPEEVRELIHTTKKTVILHSIEGAHRILEGQEDADFWASKGVTFMTLIHLVDGEYGGAAHNPGFLGRLLNYRGTIRQIFHPEKYRGLTKRGKESIRWLAKAGIMTDLTHMTPAAVSDSLKVLRELQLPPLITHSLFQPIHDSDRAVTKEQLFEVYRLDGLFSLPISGMSVRPKRPSEEFLAFIQGQELCEGSLDSYRVSFQFTQRALLQGLARKEPSELTEEEKLRYAIGWQSDFNGWLNHSRPRYGSKGCRPLEDELLEIEKKGLAHPGLLSEHWVVLEHDGMDTSSLRYASEKFLKMWEKFRQFSASMKK